MARRYGLSRSTLLYYDRIDVLTPSGRSAAGYRRYSAADGRRLARICRYRRAGLPLATIRDLLAASDAAPAAAPAANPDAAGAEANTTGADANTTGTGAGAAGDTGLTDVLAARLVAIDEEVRRLRGQQRFILAYLRDGRRLAAEPFLTGARFVELLELAGVSAEQRAHWHAAFERTAADEHQAFLEFLCLPDDDIDRIRRRSTTRADM